MGCICCCRNNNKKTPQEKLSFGTAVEEIRTSARSIMGSPLSTKIAQGDITSWVKPNLSTHYLDELDDIEESCCDKIPIIHPFGPFRLIWDSIVILLLLYTAIEVPCK